MTALSSRPTPMKVLDIAPGHGLYSIALARQNPQVQLYTADWPEVLSVTQKNAQKAGVEQQITLLPGDVFTAYFGREYDLIIIGKFLHYFGPEACQKLLNKACQALKANGRLLILETLTDENYISSTIVNELNLLMLATTAEGEAYSVEQLQIMGQQAGFHHSQ